MSIDKKVISQVLEGKSVRILLLGEALEDPEKREDPNIRKCDHCGADTEFEGKNEGQNCIKCGDWVCDTCSDWKASGDAGFVCKKCSGIKESQDK